MLSAAAAFCAAVFGSAWVGAGSVHGQTIRNQATRPAIGRRFHPDL
jgi:hypothetical protein